MEITPTTLILVGVVCVFLGILATVLLNTLRDEDVPVAGVDEAPPGGRKGRYTPLVRLWRERGASTLVVEMDGKSMISREPLNDVQRERLERAARDLMAWLGIGAAGMEAPAPDITQQVEMDLSRAIGEPAPQIEAPAQSAAEIPQSPRMQTPEIPVPVAPAPQPFTTSAAARAAVSKNTEEPAAAPAGKPVSKSIVMQIEEILQEMIAGTPLDQRGIHLVEDANHGVVVKIGIDRYEGIDAVPDPEIKRVLRTAVEEWEQGQ